MAGDIQPVTTVIPTPLVRQKRHYPGEEKDQTQQQRKQPKEEQEQETESEQGQEQDESQKSMDNDEKNDTVNSVISKGPSYCFEKICYILDNPINIMC